MSRLYPRLEFGFFFVDFAIVSRFFNRGMWRILSRNLLVIVVFVLTKTT